MTVDIREASAGDAEAISALAIRTYVDAWGADFEPADLEWHLDRSISPRRWRDYLTRDQVLWAWHGGQPVAFVQFGPGRTPGEMLIERLYVLAALQGQGIGSELLRRALAEPEMRAAEVVRIDVWHDNLRAQRLYQRFGFRHEGGLEPFVLQSGEIEGYDLILVRRRGA